MFEFSELNISKRIWPGLGYYNNKWAGLRNRPRSIYKYSNGAPELSGQNCKFFKYLCTKKTISNIGVCIESLGVIFWITIFFIAMQRIIEQKTSEAIKKLEKQFKSTFSAYTSTNDKSRKQQAHKKLEGKTESQNHIILTNLLKHRWGLKSLLSSNWWRFNEYCHVNVSRSKSRW